MGFDSKKLPRHLRNVDLPTENFTPCSYQVQLLDSALQKNVIICLSSNSGKSFIGVMTIKELSLPLSLPLDGGGKRTVFLVSSDECIDHQSNIIQHHTDLTVGKFSAERVLSWSTETWKAEIHEHQILVMMPQTFVHILDCNIFPLSQINLLVFDDCHRGIDHQEYAQIMKYYEACSSNHHPRILGLTTNIPESHPNIKPIELENIIKSLESTFHSSALTSNLVLSERYGNRPNEVLHICDAFCDPTGLTAEMSYILENSLNFLSECQIDVNEDTNSRDPRTIAKFALSECLNILYQLGPWCCENLAQMLGNQLEKSDKHETCDIHKKFLRYSMTQMRLLTQIFEQGFTPDYNVDELLLYATPRITRLVDVLRQFKPDYDFMIISGEDTCGMDLGDDFSDSDFSDSDGDGDLSDPEENRNSKLVHIAINRNLRSEKENSTPQRLDQMTPEEDKALSGIVFVEQQYVAFVLNKFLEEVCSWDENLCFIKSSHITGQGIQAIKDKKLITKAHKKQEETLRKFRMQELNVLLSTNVLEEGVDIPRCNLVVRFDTPKDYRSYSLSKGRARAIHANYVLLVDEEKSESFKEDLSLFKGIEKALIQPPKESEESLEDLENCCDLSALIPPYAPSTVEGAPKITMHSAIYIVNRYCAKLPSDAFTHLTPKCQLIQVENGSINKFVATLALPVNSPIKEEVEGDPLPTKKLAKMSVAMKMCVLLHQSGELDDQLMPIGKEIFKYEEDPELEEEEITGEARPGTTKRKQYYHKKVADALVGCYPQSNVGCYLYLFHMQLTGPITDEQNTRGRKLHAPEDSARWFGIVSSKNIPKVPAFPVYTRSGEVTVNIRLIQSSMMFDEQQISQIHHFHRYVFGDVLNLEKDPMEFLPSSAKVGCILVPLCEDQVYQDFRIDWDFVEKVETSFGVKQKNIHDLDRDSFVFEHDRFHDSVVMPAYRNIDQPQHFYVAEIRTDLSPLSPFPSPELYKTFSAYYKTKYGLSVTNNDQPLLDVDHTSARLNLLTPRYMNQKGVTLPTCSAETKRARRENLQQKQILIPEFCCVHLFPASFWRKAVCLAAIFYRMNYLLLAEELRKQIAIETGIGVTDIPETFNFSQLDFGFETCPEKLKENTNESNTPESESKSVNLKDEILSSGGDNSKENKVDVDVIGKASTSAENNQAGHSSSSETISSSSGKICEDQSDPCDVTPKSSANEDENISSSTSDLCNNSPISYSCDLLKTNCDDSNLVNEKFPQECNNAHAKGLCVHKFCDDYNKRQESSIESNDNGAINQLNNHIRCHSQHHILEQSQDKALSSENSMKDSTVESCKIENDQKLSQTCCESLQCMCVSNCTDCGNEPNPLNNGSYPNTNHQCAKNNKCVCEKCLKPSNNEIPFIKEKVNTECVSCRMIRSSSGADCNILEKDVDKSVVDKMVSNDVVDREQHVKDNVECVNGVLDRSYECKLSINCQMNNISLPTIERVCNCKKNKTVDCDNCSEELSSSKGFQTNTVSPKLLNGSSPSIIVVSKTCGAIEDTCSLNSADSNEDGVYINNLFLLDEDIDLASYIGPSPCTVLQSLTMSNANDFFSLERLETIGDSFLKYAITVYLYCTYLGIHEGKLSYLRSKEVSNYNLYRLGKRKGLAEYMISTKFDPYENWLPPGYVINESKRKGIVPKVIISSKAAKQSQKVETELNTATTGVSLLQSNLEIDEEIQFNRELAEIQENEQVEGNIDLSQSVVPYSLQTQHSIPDKSVADCVEALIGCYLTSCGRKAALLFMSWLGLKVLPRKQMVSTKNQSKDCKDYEVRRNEFGELKCPTSPLLTQTVNAESKLERLLNGYEKFEEKIQYTFKDRSYLLQAFTHASYHYNRVTDCYQRLEFLGDAILDYVITRHLYEDSRKYSPGVLTDLRSALVNNNIFAALAIKWDFHKYFKAVSPALFHVIEKFVARQKDKEDEIDIDECGDDENEEEEEELEIPKALGDIFESIAGAIYLDSGMSLDTVWRVYYRMMRPQIEKYLKSIPKSPVRELLEMEPETAKFEKPERTVEGRIRVTVNVVSKGVFTGIGRNYRIAKSAAAKKALRIIKTMQAQGLVE